MWTDLTLLALFSGPVSHYVPVGTLVLAAFGHAMLSLALTLVLSGYLPEACRRSRWHDLLIFSTAFLIPVLGYGIVGAWGYWLRRYPPVVEHTFEDVAAVMPSMFEQRSHSGKIAYAGSGLRYQLKGTKVGSDEKLRILNSVVAMPGHYAVPLLKSSIQDAAEDVRLVSHGMIDQREKEINEDIAWAQQVLAESEDALVSHDALRHLAMRYWDLVYFGLAEGEMLRFVYERVEYYAQRALETMPDDGEVLMVMGKLSLHQKKIDEAAACFRRAEELGVAASRVNIYRAEAAFYQRNFAMVRDLLSGKHAFPNPGDLLPTLMFWRSRGKA